MILPLVLVTGKQFPLSRGHPYMVVSCLVHTRRTTSQTPPRSLSDFVAPGSDVKAFGGVQGARHSYRFISHT